MGYTALLQESKMEVPSTSQFPSLYQMCQQVIDGCKAWGKRYDFAGILLVLI